MKYYITYNPDREKFDLRDKELCKTIFSSSSRGQCEARLEQLVSKTYKPDMERVYYLCDRMDDVLEVIRQRYEGEYDLTEYDLRRTLHIQAQIKIALGIPVENN